MKRKLRDKLEAFFAEESVSAYVKRPVNTWTVAHVEDYLGKAITELSDEAQLYIHRKCARFLIDHSLTNDKSSGLKLLDRYHKSLLTLEEAEAEGSGEGVRIVIVRDEKDAK